jgi:hypothetical protein
MWILLSAVLGVQATGVWAIHVRTGQLSDFGRFYYAVDAWRTAAGDLYQPTFVTPIVVKGQTLEMMNVASPLWHVVALPFTYVSPRIAFGLWVLCNVAAWAWSVRICLSQWKLVVDYRWYPAIAFGIVGSSVTAGAFHTGQYIGLLMLPATFAWRAARENRWVSVGAWLGFLSYHKPFGLIFFVWLAWNRRWRALLACMIVLVASVVVGEVVFGPGIHVQWRAALQKDVTAWTWLYTNASIWAPWARAFRPSPSFAFWQSSALAVLPALACAGTVAMVTGWRLRRPVQIDSAWTILWSAALLISPLGWTYYLWWGAGPFGAVILRAWQQQPQFRWQIWAIAACFWLPLDTMIAGQPSVFASFVVGSLFTWALMAFWMLALRDSKRNQPESHNIINGKPVAALIAVGTCAVSLFAASLPRPAAGRPHGTWSAIPAPTSAAALVSTSVQPRGYEQGQRQSRATSSKPHSIARS